MSDETTLYEFGIGGIVGRIVGLDSPAVREEYGMVESLLKPNKNFPYQWRMTRHNAGRMMAWFMSWHGYRVTNDETNDARLVRPAATVLKNQLARQSGGKVRT